MPSPAASGAPPLASNVHIASQSESASREDASGEAPNAAGEAPALPFSHRIGARVSPIAPRSNKLTVAERLAKISGEPEQQIAAAFRLALNRAPSPEESSALTAFVREHGLANACRVILNLNEFAFVD